VFVEAGEETVVEVTAAGLLVGVGVVALFAQGGFEIDGGLVEPAAFADGFEAAVDR
jgi:hypothetical protein